MEQRVEQLMDTCAEGDVNAVTKLLMDDTLDVAYASEPRGDTPLHACAGLPSSEQCYQITTLLLNRDSKLLLLENREKWTPFAVAIRHGNIKFLEVVFKHYKNNLVDWCTPQTTEYDGVVYPSGSTALHMAVHAKSCPSIRLLLSRVVKLLATDCNDKTALEVAKDYSDTWPQILQCFIDYNDFIFKIIEESTPNTNIDKYLDILFENGVSVEIRGSNQFTPLYAASRRENASVVKKLIARGVDVNTRVMHTSYTSRHENNVSALHVAVRQRNIVMVDMLLEAGADPTTVDQHNHTPLQYLIIYRLPNQPESVATAVKLCRLLIEYGGRVNTMGSEHGKLYPRPSLFGSEYSYCYPLIFTLVSAGMEWTCTDNPRTKRRQGMFESGLVDLGEESTGFMLESGYKFQHLDDIKARSQEKLASVNALISKLQAPLTLKRKAANVVRVNLQPNAWIGIKRLPLPPGFDTGYITMDLSTRSLVDPSLT